MKRQGCIFFMLCLGSYLLTGCLGGLWTSATLVYDRHHVYKKLSDYRLAANVQQALYHDAVFKQPGCVLDVAVFNGDILLAGHVPTHELRQLALERITTLAGYRRVINQVKLSNRASSVATDFWITTQIRSRIFADAAIDPQAFKIITSDRIVYLMGDVRPQEALRVIHIARITQSVERVVKLFKYYNLSQHAAVDN